ncbi:MAG: cell surface protein SprA [Candidatus Latescibacteria bacterium]|nr:cell surface protein SprA [Candidatus Latescibacterota bacterium]
MSRIPLAPFRLWTPVLALAFVSVLASVNTARAQGFTTYSIDLGEVGKLYDTLYRDRVTDEIVDSVVVYDYERIPFGGLRYKVPHFLETDVSTTRAVDDYLAVPGYRARFTVPRGEFFEPTEREAGDLILTEPRDYTIPGLTVDLRSMDDVATEIYRNTTNQIWRESARASVAAVAVTTDVTTGGITFDIPLPMPKQLESIFGPGEKTSITLRGREEITIAGETTKLDPFIGAEGRQEQSLFPSLDMQQRLDVSLTGTIGDKVSIQVDHSSEAIGDDANRVRLAYTGYEDEVIQLIELGNTSLSLPGSQLVSVSTNAQGLFGAKMLAKMGSTDVTMIASKQEGEVSNAQFTPTGGALGETEFRTIRDVDYVRNKYFYFDNPRASIGPQAAGIEVYKGFINNNTGSGGSNRTQGYAVPDPNGDGSGIDAAVAILNSGGQPVGLSTQYFELLTLGTDYTLIIDAVTDDITGIELFQAIPNTASETLAVRYISAHDSTIGGTYEELGVIEGGPKLLLEMIKAPFPDPKDPIVGSTWLLEFKNIYNLGLTNIDGNSLEVSIVDNLNPRLNPQFPDSSDVPYLKIFGLDQTDASGDAPPDGRIDLRFGRVNLDAGLLQFPILEPFIPPPDSVARWTDSAFSFTGPYAAQYDTSRAIYTDRLNTTQREEEVHQYTIEVRAVSTSKSFRINALNIVEQSEVITLDGQRLNRGSDYDIDYTTGEVTLKDSALSRLNPDSNISIDYQFKPLGGVGSSTLAGMSTTSKWGENARLGTTLLYESRSTSSDRARLGEEPTRAIVGGLTAGYQHQSRILTDIANWLPYVDSDQPSTVTFDGEIAGSLPNPNTQDEAYIDDFEGVEDTDRIGLARRSWYPASLPLEEDNTVKSDASRVGFYWYNIEPDLGLHRRDLNPTLDDQENTLLQSLDLELASAPAVDDTASYAGVMLGFSGGGLDLTQGQFLEIWVNDFKPDPLTRGGKLRIDLGIIDENFYELNTDTYHDEDKSRDGFAATFDDTGFDGLFNDAEPTLPGGTPEDPSGDDVDLGRINGRFSKVNGTEANLLYDTEDLDRNGQMGRVNAYFSFEIDLADSAEIDIRRQYPGYDGFSDAGHGNDSWRLYRVKLSDYVVRTNTAVQPRLDEIRHVRIWIDDLEEVVRTDGQVGNLRLQIAEFSIEGNRWEIDGVRNLYDGIRENAPTEFAIGVISTKTDPGVYQPPVNPNEQNQIADKESSLALRYAGLRTAEQVRILKRFLGAGLDLTLYRDLNFWVHTDSLRAGVEYYFRMASNETNYYEIAVPFTGVYYNETGWARVVVNLADLTNLKFAAPDTIVTTAAVDVADPTRAYPVRMRGQPNLTGVRFLYAGVRNVSNTELQNGEIWINDIYCGDVMRDFDHAERISANFNVAGGAISFGGNWARTGADYRGLRQSRGAGADNTVLGLNAKTDLQYFLPLLGFSIPISGSYSQTRSLPKFPPNSDTEITDASVSDSLKTVRKSRSFNVSLARRTTSNNFLMRYTLDRLRPTFSYSDQRGISPASRDTTTNMQGNVTYQMTWSGGNTVPLFGKNQFRWWINQLDLSTSANRQTGKRWSLINGVYRRDPYRYTATMRNQGTVRYNPFRSLETSFSMTQDRDLALESTWQPVNIGTEVGRSNNARVSFVSPDWRLLRLFEKPSIEVQSTYSENAGPNVRQAGDPEGTRNVSATRNDTGRIGFDIGKHIGSVFRWVGWDLANPQTTQRPPAPGGAPPDSANPVPTPPDTSQVQKPRPGAGTALRGLGRILISIRPIKANITRRKGSSYTRIPERPDWSYQLGLDNNTGIEVDGEGIGPPDTRSANLTYNLDTGVTLRENLDIQGRYSQAINDQDVRTNQNRSTSTTWPDIQARWGGLERLRVLDQSITQGELRVDWRETSVESGPKDQEPVTTTETFTLTPALVMQWKNQLNSSINLSMTENTSDTRGSRSVSTSTSIGVELKKTFRGGGGLKLFGKGIDWTNEMEATLQMAYAQSGGERFQPGSILAEPIPKTTTLSVNPLVRYTFSRNINGSAFIGYERSFFETTGVTTTKVRLGVSAVINF